MDWKRQRIVEKSQPVITPTSGSAESSSLIKSSSCSNDTDKSSTLLSASTCTSTASSSLLSSSSLSSSCHGEDNFWNRLAKSVQCKVLRLLDQRSNRRAVLMNSTTYKSIGKAWMATPHTIRLGVSDDENSAFKQYHPQYSTMWRYMSPERLVYRSESGEMEDETWRFCNWTRLTHLELFIGNSDPDIRSSLFTKLKQLVSLNVQWQVLTIDASFGSSFNQLTTLNCDSISWDHDVSFPVSLTDLTISSSPPYFLEKKCTFAHLIAPLAQCVLLRRVKFKFDVDRVAGHVLHCWIRSWTQIESIDWQFMSVDWSDVNGGGPDVVHSLPIRVTLRRLIWHQSGTNLHNLSSPSGIVQSSIIMNWCARLPNLEILDCPLVQDRDIPMISKCLKLTSISLSFLPRHFLLRYFSGLSLSIRQMKLSHISLKPIHPHQRSPWDVLQHVRIFTSLTTLDLSYMSSSEPLPLAMLEPLRDSLTALSLHGVTDITDDIWTKFHDLFPKLAILDVTAIRNPDSTRVIMDMLPRLSSLTALGISFTGINDTEEVLAFVGKCRKLLYLETYPAYQHDKIKARFPGRIFSLGEAHRMIQGTFDI